MWWLLLLWTTTLAVAGCGSDRHEKKKAQSTKKPPTGSSTKTTRSSKVSGKRSSKLTRSNKPDHSSKTVKSKKSSKSGKKKGSKSSKKIKKVKSASKSAESSKESAPLSSLLQAVEIHAHPAELSFASIGGLQTFRFVNETNQRRVFKVKCSDNQLYRVSPVFGVVEPKGQITIDVLRQNGSVKVDKLVLVTAQMPIDVTKPPKEILADSKNSQMTVVPLLVEA